MKRLFYSTIFILFVSLFFVVPDDVWSDVGVEPKIIVAGKIIEQHKVSLYARCFSVLDGKTLPCSFQAVIDKAHTENCSGAAHSACGHNDAHHTVSRADILKNNDAETFRILGGLTDSGQAEMTTKLPERKPPAEYNFTYHSGEIAGKITLKIELKNPPPGWRFIKPWCKKEDVCTLFQNVNVEHCGGKFFCQRFVELPQPLPPNEYNIYWSDGYVRCGMSSACSIPDVFNPADWLVYDKPYNWPAHPTVHWGKWDFNFELMMLAKKWYEVFGRPLVINDISLPKGGLLDVSADWTVRMGHSSHRKGVDADILGISVISVGRPEGPKDEQWVRLYSKYKLLENRGLIYIKRDYNHLKFTGGINTSTNY